MSEYILALHTFRKDGIFYFRQRVPVEIRQHYTSPDLSYSLRTKSPRVASTRAMRATMQLDEYWYHLRSQDSDLPGKHLLRMGMAKPHHGTGGNSADFDSGCMSLSDAVAT